MSEEPAEESPRPPKVDDEGEPAPSEEAGASPDEAEAPKPVRKKRKKKRPVEEAEAPAAEEKLAGAADVADARPAFARTFPADPELDELVSAFEQGNYARVRREAPALAKRTESADVRRAARELARRIEPDPIATYLFAAAALLLVFLAFWYWTHPHEVP